MELNQIYCPITSTPFKTNAEYIEIKPCSALNPYVKCFWGSKKPIGQCGENTLVIPDTCMDIIFTANYTDNIITDKFCCIDDRAFISHGQTDKTVFTFGIRFYPWGAAMFAEDSLKNSQNAFFNADVHFSRLRKIIEPLLFDISDMCEIIPAAEQVLLNSLNEKHKNNTVIEAIGIMLESRGNLLIGKLADDIHISERQLERLFKEYIGCSVKGLASLIRYQYLWNEIMFNNRFDIWDAVLKYGYSDQPHLLNDFKKFHSLNIKEAKAHALKNVGNLQDSTILI